jgi:hypothetical protein
VVLVRSMLPASGKLVYLRRTAGALGGVNCRGSSPKMRAQNDTAYQFFRNL